jgi:dTDP-4-dehydrorhamnose 3,5-epimerase
MSVTVFRPRRFVDDRGWFCEVFNARHFASITGDITFVQDNVSYSRDRGTLRGLHFQTSPFAQAKLVRCLKGRFLDVVVDIRKGSPTFGHSLSYELSADKGDQIFVPIGFAHGLVTLEPDTEIGYKVSNYYSTDHDRGLRWDDPTLNIDWHMPSGGPYLSPKDQGLPLFKDFESPFFYGGTPMALTIMAEGSV